MNSIDVFIVCWRRKSSRSWLFLNRCSARFKTLKPLVTLRMAHTVFLIGLLKPVSYTHLDVYKRQGPKQRVTYIERLSALGAAWSTRVNSRNSSAHMPALSVVEKRQKTFVANNQPTRNASGVQRQNTIPGTVVLRDTRKHQHARSRRQEAKTTWLDWEFCVPCA